MTTPGLTNPNFRSGYLAQGAPLGAVVGTVSLIADNTAVSLEGISLLQITSNNTTAANRTFTLSPSTQLGQTVVLEVVSGSSTTCQLATGGYTKLTGTWEGVQYQTLTLQWDGNFWVEIARSNTTLPTDVALTAAHLLVGNSLNVATDTAITGDIAITDAGVTSIASGVIVNADVSASAAIAYSKLATLTSGNILVGSAGNVATSVAMSGDATIVASGAVTISENIYEAASVSITQAQMLALSTPVTLVAAQGTGKVIVVDEIEIRHNYSTAPYATGSDVSVEYETSGTDIVLIADTFFQDTSNANTVIKPTVYNLDASTGTGSGLSVASMANKAVQVVASNFTLGNAANTFTFRVRYHVVTLLTS